VRSKEATINVKQKKAKLSITNSLPTENTIRFHK